MSYAESKKKLDEIRQEYGCKGDIIFRTAIQYIVEHGQYNFKNQTWFDSCLTSVDKRHDIAEKDGKILFMTRDFEKALLECARELAQITAYDLLTYIQREVWLGGGKVGEPDYQRAMEIIRNCLCYTSDCYGTYAEDCASTLRKFREMDLTDEEIAFFGWGYLFDVEDEEDEEE
jgi:hypothetical protein